MAILGGNKTPEKPVAQAPTVAPTTTPTAPVKAAEEAPAKSTRGRKPGTPSKALELNLDGLQVAVVTDPREMAKARRTRGERSADQKRLDAMVETAWQAWKDKGEPTEWPKMPGVRLRIATANYETLVAGIRKAGNFYDLKVRFGKPTIDGNVTEIVFVVTDRPEKNDDTDDDE